MFTKASGHTVHLDPPTTTPTSPSSGFTPTNIALISVVVVVVVVAVVLAVILFIVSFMFYQNKGTWDLDYSETCSCDHLYSETNCIQRPPVYHLVMSQLWLYNAFLPLLRDHFYSKTTFFWPKRGRSLNTGFTVCTLRKHML